MKTNQIYQTKTFLQDYWNLLKGSRLKFTFYTAIKALSTSGGFIIAFLVGFIVDFFVNYTPQQILTPFYLAVLGIGVIGVMQVWLRFFAKFRLHKLAGNIRKNTRVRAMEKLIDFDLKWHEKEDTGSKIEKINSGSEAIFTGIHIFSNEGIDIIVGIVVAMAIFIALDWRYALFGLGYSTIYILGEMYFNKNLTLLRIKTAKIKEKVSGKFHESSSNLLTVKSLGLKEIFTKSTQDYEERYYKIWLKAKKFGQLKMKTIKMFAALGYAFFLLMVGFDALNISITVGSIYVYSSYFNKLKNALENITHKSHSYIDIKTKLGRFMMILGRDYLDERTKVFPKNWKTIEFKNVSFKYKNKYVLKNFNLKINKGEKIGIIGKSGCGKSTLVKLLLGLYKPQKGRILINGTAIKDIKHNSVTKNISIVLQDSEMFNLRLIDNLTISGKKDYKRLEKAVDISQLKKVIEKLPKGLNTMLGEKGYKLSGGERQRVGIARAIYKDADILILDESTSNLDRLTEANVLDKLEKLNKTMIIIAHRLSTIKDVDRVIDLGLI